MGINYAQEIISVYWQTCKLNQDTISTKLTEREEHNPGSYSLTTNESVNPLG